MVRRLAGVLTGFLLLSTGGYFSWRVAEGWQNQPSALAPRAAATPSADRVSSDAQDPDPNDGTNIRPATQVQSVFGNLFSPAPAPQAQTNPTPVPQSSSPRSSAAIDHVTSPLKDPTARVHQRFAVQTYQGFLFVVPPRTIHPELHGSFRSVTGPGAVPTGRRANIQVLLFNQQEFDSFAHGRERTATFTNDPSDSGRVDWALASPLFEAQKYYLIFRNSPEASSPKIVDADFTLSFE
jgi:hypothetical protein